MPSNMSRAIVGVSSAATQNSQWHLGILAKRMALLDSTSFFPTKHCCSIRKRDQHLLSHNQTWFFDKHSSRMNFLHHLIALTISLSFLLWLKALGWTKFPRKTLYKNKGKRNKHPKEGFFGNLIFLVPVPNYFSTFKKFICFFSKLLLAFLQQKNLFAMIPIKDNKKR